MAQESSQGYVPPLPGRTIRLRCALTAIRVAKFSSSSVAINLHSPGPRPSLLGMAVLYVALTICKPVMDWTDRRSFRERVLQLGLDLQHRLAD